MRAPFDRLDFGLAATVAASPGFGHLAAAAETGGVGVAAMTRFVEEPLFVFAWRDAPSYVTGNDALALAASAVLLIRFTAWAFGPLFSGRRSDDGR